MSGLRAHQRLGYSKSKMVVIPNGYCRQIKKTNQTYNDIVKKYHLQNEHFVFGMVGRYDKLKGKIYSYPQFVIWLRKLKKVFDCFCWKRS